MRKLATETIAKIDSFLEEDQGNLYRALLQKTLPTLSDAYAQDDTGHRKHLGASLLGRKCARDLWYTFRWATLPTFPGRILRLFNRGHLEEGRLVALLEMIGCTVYQFDENGSQYRISGHGGHYGGGLDCVIVGLPEMPETPVLGEFKTHSDKSFSKLVDNGLYASKFEHYAQMTQYMGEHQLSHGLYLACNKNDDALYGEIIAYDPGVHNNASERAGRIIDADEPPQRISKTSTWYECKFCTHNGVCWQKKAPDRNCRTCQFSAPAPNGLWWCRHHGKYLAKDDQLTGCDNYTEKEGMRE